MSSFARGVLLALALLLPAMSSFAADVPRKTVTPHPSRTEAPPRYDIICREDGTVYYSGSARRIRMHRAYIWFVDLNTSLGMYVPLAHCMAIDRDP